MLRSGEISRFHRVRSDEVWHYYKGDPLELHTLNEEGEHQTLRLGPEIAQGQRPQALVAASVWQAARPLSGPQGYCLVGCTVAPGFEFADFEMPSTSELILRFPQHESLLKSFAEE
jgi:predicted cupin superfamily sugar epimerase